ncbi:MAG: uroporphyrinogen-III synthase [Hyphomicrobiaceae bacterium]
MRLLVTRPEPDAMKLAGRLEQEGHEVAVEPLMRLTLDDTDPIDLDGASALIATSRNALRALRASPALAEARHIPIFVVGKATAAEARSLGFKRILVGAGQAADLVPAIAATQDSTDGLLVHLAGETLAFDLKSELELLGFRVLQITVYRMEATEAFSASTIDVFADEKIDGVILMSPQTARIYAHLVARHRLAYAIPKIVHFCMSAAIAGGLATLGQVRVAIPDRPTVEGLLAEIELTAAHWDE